MRAFIYTGGDCFPENIPERPAQGDLILAADVGYRTALLFGVRPQILLGDFDSLGDPPADAGAEIIRVPSEKDLTDTQLAVRVALDRGADSVCIVGGLGGRTDHTLSNLALLENLYERKVPALLTTGDTRVRFLRNGSALLLREGRYRYLSLICADRKVRGVTMRGCRYPLEKATLYRDNQFAISNEWEENYMLIGVRRGGVWILEEIENRGGTV